MWWISCTALCYLNERSDEHVIRIAFVTHIVLQLGHTFSSLQSTRECVWWALHRWEASHRLPSWFLSINPALKLSKWHSYGNQCRNELYLHLMGISPSHFTETSPSYARKSIRNTLEHGFGTAIKGLRHKIRHSDAGTYSSQSTLIILCRKSGIILRKQLIISWVLPGGPRTIIWKISITTPFNRAQ